MEISCWMNKAMLFILASFSFPLSRLSTRLIDCILDFGFILDIAPGGVNFESSPFKLTTEMIEVMGGKVEMQPYVWFCELCIKAYLAIRYVWICFFPLTSPYL